MFGPKKISELTEKLSIDNNDLFALVDSVGTPETKKVKASTLAASIAPLVPVPNLNSVLMSGNNGGGLTIENISNSTLSTGLVNKGYVDAVPRVHIKDLAWFNANASTVFAEGNVFYFKDTNHPNGTGVKKVADGVTQLSALPILVDDYQIRGRFRANYFDNFLRENNKSVFLRVSGTVSNSAALNQTIFTNVLIKKPIRLTRVNLFINSITGTVNVQAKIFKLNSSFTAFDQIYSQNFNLNTTGYNALTLTTPQDLMPDLYLIGFYYASGTLTYRFFSNAYVGVLSETGYGLLSGNVTTVLVSQLNAAACQWAGYNYQDLI